MSSRAKRPIQDPEALAAEEAAKSPKALEDLSPEEARLMLHELRVHQIELEMQNEELRRTQAELHAAQARYFDLYDLAPVGYFTLSEQGLVLQANLAAATALGADRRGLLKQAFTRFIAKEDQDVFYLLRKQVLETGGPGSCELRMVPPGGEGFRAHLAATAAKGNAGELLLRLVLMRCPGGAASGPGRA
jgi:PAS domain S-box-containing protein